METKITFQGLDESNPRVDISLKDVPVNHLKGVLGQLPESIAKAYDAEIRLFCAASCGIVDLADGFDPERFILQRCTE